MRSPPINSYISNLLHPTSAKAKSHEDDKNDALGPVDLYNKGGQSTGLYGQGQGDVTPTKVLQSN